MPPTRPAHWVDHPVTPITRRAVLIGIAITLLAIFAAVLSVYARRTRLQKTTQFWGADTILALQLAPQVTMQLDPPPPPVAGGQADAGAAQIRSAGDPRASPANGPQGRKIDLTGTPGLGHLRHALLDERHYDWSTRRAATIASLQGPQSRFATLSFSDPDGRYPTATVALELTEGWAGRPGIADRVRLTDRAQPAVRHFLNLISNAQQAHYDNR